MVTDIAVVVGIGIAFGYNGLGRSAALGQTRIEYWMAAAALALVWIVVLAGSGVWDVRVLGRGSNEFRRLGGAAQLLVCAVGVLAYVTRAQFGRTFIVIALPIGILGILLSHALWRHWLVRQRRRGRMLTSVLVVGHSASAWYLARRLREVPHSGYRVVGLCVPGEDVDPAGPDSGSVGIFEDIMEALSRTGATAVAITSGDQFGGAQVRNLAWRLEGTGIRLIVTPSLVDVAGPRIHITQVAGLPLMQVEVPRFEGPTLIVKSVFDVVAAALGLLLLSPLMVVAALAVKLGDGGPVFFRQPRVGLDGQTFVMWKFRSMVRDAEPRLARLLDASQGNGVLFKMKNDPRITRVGAVLRRLSIDELPQLLNVLTGKMSLVGPRPPLTSEVVMYGAHVHRRFLVKPGLTGLWQIGGRSGLTWDESVRLDLYYVENWSLTGDLVILAKTAGAVLGRSGAY